LRAVERETPPPAPTPTPKTDWAAKITQNFGYSEGEKLFFTGPDNVSYHAVKTTTGWQIYKGGLGGIGGEHMETTGTANKSLEPYLMKAGQEKMLNSTNNDQASALANKSQEVAMARANGRSFDIINVGSNNNSSGAAVPKTDRTNPGVSRSDLTPAFTEVPVG
jgi:hypothetical protein